MMPQAAESADSLIDFAALADPSARLGTDQPRASYVCHFPL
jgi:hypothetical protein